PHTTSHRLPPLDTAPAHAPNVGDHHHVDTGGVDLAVALEHGHVGIGGVALPGLGPSLGLGLAPQAVGLGVQAVDEGHAVLEQEGEGARHHAELVGPAAGVARLALAATQLVGVDGRQANLSGLVLAHAE